MKKIIIIVLIIFAFLFKLNSVRAEEKVIETEVKNDVMYIIDDDGKFSYSWSFNRNLKKDINFDLKINSKSPYKTEIDNLLNANKEYVSFNYHGNLPGVAKIKIPIKKFKDNSRLKLYYYNDKTNKVELINDNVVVENGYVTFEINHCSDYFFTASVVKDVNEKNTGGIAIIAMIIIIVAMLGYTLFVKK